MSDEQDQNNQNQQNQNKNKGNQQQKTSTGMGVTAQITPADLGDRKAMSGFFTFLAIGAAAILAMTHVKPLVDKHLFRVKAVDDKPNPQVAFNVVQDKQVSDKLRLSLMTSAVNNLADGNELKKPLQALLSPPKKA